MRQIARSQRQLIQESVLNANSICAGFALLKQLHIQNSEQRFWRIERSRSVCIDNSAIEDPFFWCPGQESISAMYAAQYSAGNTAS